MYIFKFLLKFITKVLIFSTLFAVSYVHPMRFTSPLKFTSYEGLTQDKLDEALLESASENNTKGVKELIERKANVNAKIRQKNYDYPVYNCSLHAAAMHGYINIMQLLLDAGANINLETHPDTTPLALAIHCAREKSVTFLLERGARVRGRDSEGLTLYQFAQQELEMLPKNTSRQKIVETIATHLEILHHSELLNVLQKKQKSHDIFFIFEKLSNKKRTLDTLKGKKTKKRK